MQEVILIAHNLRSCHNIGSLLRTAEGLGVQKVYLTGYTPYPIQDGDTRMPHIARKLHAQIHKTALGAEDMVTWEHNDNIDVVISRLRHEGYEIVALEQGDQSVPLPDFRPTNKTALIVGREVEGVEQGVLGMCDRIAEIPMKGKKESFNVSVAAAMALYHLTYRSS